jgi:hypothetical protein
MILNILLGRQQPLAGRQFQKVKRVFILDRQLCLFSVFFRYRLIKIRLIEQVFLVAFVLNLVDEYVFGPAVSFGHSDVKLALKIVFAFTENHNMFGPANFRSPHILSRIGACTKGFVPKTLSYPGTLSEVLGPATPPPIYPSQRLAAFPQWLYPTPNTGKSAVINRFERLVLGRTDLFFDFRNEFDELGRIDLFHLEIFLKSERIFWEYNNTLTKI